MNSSLVDQRTVEVSISEGTWPQGSKPNLYRENFQDHGEISCVLDNTVSS